MDETQLILLSQTDEVVRSKTKWNRRTFVAGIFPSGMHGRDDGWTLEDAIMPSSYHKF
jgi:hypothetical protein